MNDDEDEFYWNAATQNAAALCVTPTCLSACLTTSRRISSHIWTRESLSSWTVWGAPETWCPRGVGVRSRSGERRCLHPARHCCVQSRVWGLMTVRMLWRSACPSMDTPPVMQNNATGSMFPTLAHTLLQLSHVLRLDLKLIWAPAVGLTSILVIILEY